MVKFKYTKRRNPQKKDEAPKWYATPTIVNRMATRSVCKAVTKNTTYSPTEVEASFNLVCDSVPFQLQQGNSVQLGRLGWIRLGFGSEGVLDFKDFNPQSMIKNIKVIFTPSKELLNDIKQGLTFENVGVVENGFTYPSTKAYNEYTITGRKPGEDTEEGEGDTDVDEGEEEKPFG